jgi:hypothetical protein
MLLCRPADGDASETAEGSDAVDAGEGNGRALFTKPMLSLLVQAAVFAVLFFFSTISLNSFDGFRCTDRDFCNPNRFAPLS